MIDPSNLIIPEVNNWSFNYNDSSNESYILNEIEIINVSRIISNRLSKNRLSKENKIKEDKLKKEIIKVIDKANVDFIKLVLNNNTKNNVEPSIINKLKIENYIKKYFSKITYNTFSEYYGEVICMKYNNKQFILPQGFGVMIYKLNDTYIGWWNEGRKNGRGEIDYDLGDGNRYIWSGQFILDIKQETNTKLFQRYWVDQKNKKI